MTANFLTDLEARGDAALHEDLVEMRKEGLKNLILTRHAERRMKSASNQKKKSDLTESCTCWKYIMILN